MKRFAVFTLVLLLSLALFVSRSAAAGDPPALNEAQTRQIAAIDAEYKPKLGELDAKIRDMRSHAPKSGDPFEPSAKPLTSDEEAAWNAYVTASNKVENERENLAQKYELARWDVFTADQRKGLSVKALESQTVVEFVETPPKDVLDYLHDLHHIHFIVDASAASVLADDKSAITLNVKDSTLDSGLRLVLDQVGLAHILRDGSIVIASKAAAQKYLAQGAIDPAPLIAPKKAERIKQIQAALARTVTCEFNATPLGDVLDYLGDKSKIRILTNNDGPNAADRIDVDQKITVNLKALPLQDAFARILTPAKLTYVVRDEVIMVRVAKVDAKRDAGKP